MTRRPRRRYPRAARKATAGRREQIRLWLGPIANVLAALARLISAIDDSARS